MKHRIRLYRLFMVGFALLLSTPRLVLCQDYLTEEQVALTFGDLNRPAEVLLGEAEARLARANLAMLLQEYSHGQAVLGELRRKSRFGLLDPEAIATDEISTSSKRHEQFLKQTETRIHEVCEKLDSSWLLPVQTGLDDGQYSALMNKAPQVLVTIRSRSGAVLHPVKLSLTSSSDPAIGFAQIRPGVFLANPPVGEYQLAWQLSEKSVVQRLMGFKVEKPVCHRYEVTLGSPVIKMTTETSPLAPTRTKKTDKQNSPLDPPGDNDAPPSLE